MSDIVTTRSLWVEWLQSDRPVSFTINLEQSKAMVITQLANFTTLIPRQCLWQLLLITGQATSQIGNIHVAPHIFQKILVFINVNWRSVTFVH